VQFLGGIDRWLTGLVSAFGRHIFQLLVLYVIVELLVAWVDKLAAS
jgi:hypothetical protein